MIKKILSIYSFLIILNSNAQNFEIRFADIEKNGFTEVHKKIIGYSSNSFDILRVKYSAFGEATIYADHFEKGNLMRKYSIEIFKKDLYKTSLIKHKITFEDAFVLDSSLIVLFSNFDPEKLENDLYAVQYTNGYLIGNPIKIIELPTHNRFEKGSFIIKYDTKTKVFIAIGIEENLKTDGEVFHIATYNHELNVLFKQNLDIPFKENKYELTQLEVDEQNNLFMLFKIILNKDQRDQYKLPNCDYYFSLLQLGKMQDEDYLQTVLNIEDKSVYNMWLDVKQKPNKVLLTGLYNNKKSDLNPKGIYFVELEKDSTKPSSIKIQSFEDNFIPDFETESPFVEITENEPNIELKDLIMMPDKGYYLLAEYVFINETCMPDYRSALMNCNYNYYYNDIFVFKFDSTGTLQKKHRIPKRQFTRNDAAIYSSFAYGIIKNKLVLLYNENAKNLKSRNPANLYFMTDVKNANLSAVSIDEKGVVEKEFIIYNNKRKTWCKPQLFFSNNEQSIFIFSEKAKMFQSIEIK